MGTTLTPRTSGVARPADRSPSRGALRGPLRPAGSNAALQRALSPAGHLPLRAVAGIAGPAGNRALGSLLHPSVAVQRLLSINEFIPLGRSVAPKEALTRYIGYLKREAAKYERAAWMLADLDGIQAKVDVAGLTPGKIGELRGEIDGIAGPLRKIEEENRPAAKIDSDITQVYRPLKACVLQSLEQFGVLGMTAAEYHAKLWKDDDDLKYYDMDTKIGPIYQRFGLTERDAEGQTFAQLSASLPVGKYVVNVTSPAGPNGHMFCLIVDPPSAKNKPNKVYSRQDPANTQSWQPSDKILRYWVKA
ncbi:MAG TPA: hypothetical protein VFW71_06015 [Actinomycetota bacterium]|nr:hypothetical protein [Actinomycetota bacterium]